MKKNIVFLCVAAIATAMSCLITSCETLDPEANQPSFTLSLFHVVKYPGAEEAEKTIETFDGKKIWINIQSYLDGRDYEEARMVPVSEGNTDYYYIELKLTKHGKGRWAQLMGRYRNDQLVCTIDGKHYATFVQEGKLDLDNLDWVRLNTTFDPYYAKNIVESTPKNYSILCPDPASIW